MIPAWQFHHASGHSDASVQAYVVDPNLLTGEMYRVTFDDSISSVLRYDIINVTTGEKVVAGAKELDGRMEGPSFDGTRLVIGNLEETEIDHERSGWEPGSSTLESNIYLPSVNFGGETVEGYPYPADYVISLFDHVVDTSVSAFGAMEMEMMFTVTNRMENRQIDVAFIDADGDHSLSRFDELFFLEPSDSSQFLLTWAVFFGGQAGAILPQPGDKFVVRTLKPLNADDVYEFIATVTPVELARMEVSPSSTDLMLGESQQFSTAGYGVDGLPVFRPETPEWSATGGNIDSDGLFTATVAGEFTVTASVGHSSITGSAVVRVIPCTALGDVNGDGSVDVTDVVAMVNYIIGFVPAPFESGCADFNGDERIDVLDVIACICVILEGE